MQKMHLNATDTKAMSTPVMHVTQRSDTTKVHATSQVDCNKKDEMEVP